MLPVGFTLRFDVVFVFYCLLIALIGFCARSGSSHSSHWLRRFPSTGGVHLWCAARGPFCAAQRREYLYPRRRCLENSEVFWSFFKTIVLKNRFWTQKLGLQPFWVFALGNITPLTITLTFLRSLLESFGNAASDSSGSSGWVLAYEVYSVFNWCVIFALAILHCQTLPACTMLQRSLKVLSGVKMYTGLLVNWLLIMTPNS